MKNIVILISGNGSNLQAIIDSVKNGKVSANIAAVISDKKDAFGLKRAQKAGIKTIVVEAEKNISKEDYDKKLKALIEPLCADLIVLAGFMRILSPDFVNAYNNRMLNIHPSLLPAYKGLNTHKRVLKNQDKWHGASVHFVTSELDNGPVVIQARLPVEDNDDSKSLAKKVLIQEHIIYPKAIQWFCQSRFSFNDGKVLLDNKELSNPKIINNH